MSLQTQSVQCSDSVRNLKSEKYTEDWEIFKKRL